MGNIITNDKLVEILDDEIDEFAKQKNLDPILLKLILRTRGSIIANQIIGNKPK